MRKMAWCLPSSSRVGAYLQTVIGAENSMDLLHGRFHHFIQLFSGIIPRNGFLSSLSIVSYWNLFLRSDYEECFRGGEKIHS